ncbi:POTRA domain-containing protein [Algibacter sp. AS12]|uniref:POTRA domain-containing protein n=1 Tax=Algibacter sp. AS12 TaxID=3135773 RepID=UPI00398B574C
MQKPSYFILIIYILFSIEGLSQNLILKIKGESELETRIIDSVGYVKFHKDYASIRNETKAAQNKFSKLGYIENELFAIKKINDTTFHSTIHLKNKFDSLYIYYDNTKTLTSTLNLISNDVYNDYFILKLQDVENALNIINTEISQKGFPFAKVKLSQLEIKNNTTLKAELKTSNNTAKRTITNIKVKGYEKFPKSYLKHYLKIKQNQNFDIDNIKLKTEQLSNLNFANEVKTPEVLFLKDSTTLYLYLEKSKSNNFDGFLGFGTNEETNKLEFDGYLNLKLNNNLNFGESFSLLYKSDENDQKTFEVKTELPYLFNSPIGVNLMLKIFKKDTSFTTVNQHVKINYQINSSSKIFTGITTTESNNTLTNNNSLNINDYHTTQFNLAYQYIKPQYHNLLFPINSKIYFETGIGNRTATNNKEKQSQLLFEITKIINLNDKNSIYIKTNGNNLISNSYFENELLRFGGINSLRGFEENSLNATFYSLINTEYRYQLNNSIYIHSIIDASYFENKIQNTQEKLFGYGFGFAILTKSGLLKLNYANGKNENTPFKLANSKLHISLTANF